MSNKRIEYDKVLSKVEVKLFLKEYTNALFLRAFYSLNECRAIAMQKFSFNIANTFQHILTFSHLFLILTFLICIGPAYITFPKSSQYLRLMS